MVSYSVKPEQPQRPMHAEPFHRYIFDDGTVWTEFFRDDSGYLLRFPGLADFNVSADGESVSVYPAIGSDELTIEHLYINQVNPLALSRQGRPAFHASVVTVPSGCVGFLGNAGAGKSTLAASFALEEAAFLTDDALIIDESNGIRAMPGHASLRLWEDSMDALIPESTQQAGAISYSRKARLLANDVLQYIDGPTPLLAAFVLEQNGADSVTIAPLSGSSRHMAWISNSFLLDIGDNDLLARHFDWTYRIASQVPTFSLDYPRNYGILGHVRDAVRQHVAKSDN